MHLTSKDLFLLIKETLFNLVDIESHHHTSMGEKLTLDSHESIDRRPLVHQILSPMPRVCKTRLDFLIKIH